MTVLSYSTTMGYSLQKIVAFSVALSARLRVSCTLERLFIRLSTLRQKTFNIYHISSSKFVLFRALCIFICVLCGLFFLYFDVLYTIIFLEYIYREANNSWFILLSFLCFVCLHFCNRSCLFYPFICLWIFFTFLLLCFFKIILLYYVFFVLLLIFFRRN